MGKGKKGRKLRERGEGRKKGGRGMEDREQERDTRHTNPSLLPSPLPTLSDLTYNLTWLEAERPRSSRQHIVVRMCRLDAWPRGVITWAI